MSEDARAEPGVDRGGRAPRSTLWRGILGSAPVVSSALALELGRDLVVNSFGDTEVVKALAATLRSLAVLLVAGGVLFAVYRWYVRRRDGETVARELEMLLELDEPGAPVVGVPAPARVAPFTTVRTAQGLVAQVLRELPPRVRVGETLVSRREFDSSSLLAVLTAILDTVARVPGSPPLLPTRWGPQPRRPAISSATDLLGRLLEEEILRVEGPQRYSLRTVPRIPRSAQEVRSEPAWAAAVGALLRHQADRASSWAVATGHLRYAAQANRWFEASAPTLRELVRQCADDAVAAQVPASALPELVRLIDALEVWYAGAGAADATGFDALCRAVAAIPGVEGGLPLHRDLLRVRGGLPITGPARYRPMRWSTAVAVRRGHAEALTALNEPVPDLFAVARDLERVWWLLPRTDIGAEVCALINLAVTELRRGRLAAAEDRLDLVLARTVGGREPGARAHAHELTGVLRWASGDPRRALRSWQIALTGYRALGEDVGTARCLRHLGSALYVSPGYAAGVIDAGSALHRNTVWTQVSGWLATAEDLDPLDPASGMAAENYRGKVADDLRRASLAALTGVDRWPVPIQDPELSD